MKYISAAALMLAMAACSNDENLDSTYTNDSDAVRINATVGEGIPITRSNPIGTTPEEQAKFNNGDQIAVAAGTQAAVTYQYDGTAWTPAAGAYLKWASDPMSFTAYYPVGNGISMEAFTLPTDQSTLANLTTADYMTCAATSVAKADNINLTLLRKTARIVISGITLNDQFEKGYTVSEIKVSGNSTGYAGGTVQTGSTIQVSSYKTGTAADSKFYALLTPTTIDANATFLTLTVKKTADNTITTLLVKGIPATEAGMSYTYTLAVGKDLAQVGSVTVENWTDGTPIGGGEAEEVIPNYTKYNEKGAGTETDPYQIVNETQLKDLATQNNTTASIAANTYFKLLYDIALSGAWTPIGIKDQPFKGHFDGNGHSVTGITITQDISFIGLFGYTATGSSIENLSVNGIITNTAEKNIERRAGILVGYNKGGITNCSAAGTVMGTPKTDGVQALNVGGLVGYNDAGTITACSSTAAVEGKNTNTSTTVGSLVGSNNNGSSIIACYATGTVTADGTSAYVGGLVGNNNSGIIYACYATGAVTANGTSAYVGGLVGKSTGYIYACYSTGEVAAANTNTNVGSLVGHADGTFEYCLTTGSIGTADANRVLNSITVNGAITGVGAAASETIAAYCHGGNDIKTTLNAEDTATGTGFGMLNAGIKVGASCLSVDCPYHYVAGSNTPVLAPGAP